MKLSESDIDIERLKDILVEYGVIERETETPIKEILRTATEFKINLTDKSKNLFNGEHYYNSIKFTISWNSPKGEKEHFWIIPLEDYRKAYHRQVIFEKFNSNTFWKSWMKKINR